MKRVVVEVLGGVAEVTECSLGVEVLILDHDNENTDGYTVTEVTHESVTSSV